MVGIHLPISNDRMAAMTVNQMNARTNRISPTVVPPRCRMWGPPRGKKNNWNVVAARIASVPPTQIGLDTQ